METSMRKLQADWSCYISEILVSRHFIFQALLFAIPAYNRTNLTLTYSGRCLEQAFAWMDIPALCDRAELIGDALQARLASRGSALEVGFYWSRIRGEM